MQIKVYVYGTDVSDYVVDLGDVPVVNRNEDFSPVLEGFSISLMKTVENLFFPSDGDVVEIEIDGDLRYKGYVTEPIYDYDKNLWKFDVRHLLLGLDAVPCSNDDFLDPVIAAVPAGASTQNVGSDSGTDEIDWVSHTVVVGDIVSFKNTGSGFPGGLSENKLYVVTSVTTDAFKVALLARDSGAGDVDITSDVASFGLYPFSSAVLFCDPSNLYMDGAFISVKFLFTSLFTALNLNTVTTDVDSQVFYYDSPTSYGWDDVSLNLASLLNFGRSGGGLIPSSLATDEYKSDIKTCLDVLNYYCSVLGVSIKYTDTDEYTLQMFPRLSTGVPDTGNNAHVYTVADDDKISYSKKNLIPYSKTGGYNYSIEKADSFDASPAASAEYELTVDGTGETTLDVPANSQIYLGDPSALGASEVPLSHLVYFLIHVITAYNANRETTTTYFVDTKDTVKENWLLPDKRLCKIVQERPY